LIGRNEELREIGLAAEGYLRESAKIGRRATYIADWKRGIATKILSDKK
jgi:hypothetical protein